MEAGGGAAPPDPPAPDCQDWAGLPRDLLEAAGRAVPAEEGRGMRDLDCMCFETTWCGPGSSGRS